MPSLAVIVLLVWLFAQPWLRWPQLYPDVSHRLTLVAVSAAMGMVVLNRSGNRQAFPRIWQGVWWLSVLVMGVHLWPLVQSAGYFYAFLETAALCDGLLVVVLCGWGLWALGQWPVAWLRRVRWAGFLLLFANLVIGVWQRQQGQHVVGFLGVERSLGAYAVAWLPIMVAWSPWLVVVPLAIVALAASHVSWMGAVVAVGMIRPRWLWWMTPLAVVGFLWASNGHQYLWSPDPNDLDRFSKVHQRIETWGPVVQATAAHPVIGWSFGPMAYANVQRDYGARLPSVHSDWLALALFGGWPLLIAVAWAFGSLLRSPPQTVWMQATRASFAAIGIMSMVQGVVSYARLLGVMLVLLAWWWVEAQQTSKESPT